MCWRGRCPSRSSRACLALPPAHPAKNTAGLKLDLPTVWPAQSSRLPDAWLCPHHRALGTPYYPRTECKGGPRARTAKPGNPSLLGQEPGPALYPLPSVNPLPHQTCPGGTGPHPAFSRHPALPGLSLWPKPQTPRAHEFLSEGLYLSSMTPWASVSWTRPLLADYQLPESWSPFWAPPLPHPS